MSGSRGSPHAEDVASATGLCRCINAAALVASLGDRRNRLVPMFLRLDAALAASATAHAVTDEAPRSVL